VAEIQRVCGLVLFLGGEIFQGLQLTTKAIDLSGPYGPSKIQRDHMIKIRLSQESGDIAMREDHPHTAIEYYTKALRVIVNSYVDCLVTNLFVSIFKLLGQGEDVFMGGPLRAMFLYVRAVIRVEVRSLYLFIRLLHLAHFLKLFQYQEALEDIDAVLVLIPNDFTALRRFQILRMRAIIKFYLMEYRDGMNDLQMARELMWYTKEGRIMHEEYDTIETRLNDYGYGENSYRQVGTYDLDFTTGPVG
jgi:tetratricopeptide (TPR) repeat protein